jgi:hypothetical protein
MEPIMIGGQMISPHRPVSPRSVQQKQVPQQQQYRHHVFAEEFIEEDDQDEMSPQHTYQQARIVVPHRRQASSTTTQPTATTIIKDLANESTWERLLHRCRYRPQISERELVNLEWITLRELLHDLGFADNRDDMIDIYESWRERNATQNPERWKWIKSSSALSTTTTVAAAPRASSASINTVGKRREQHQHQHQPQQLQLYQYAPPNQDGNQQLMSSLLIPVVSQPSEQLYQPTQQRGITMMMTSPRQQQQKNSFANLHPNNAVSLNNAYVSPRMRNVRF